MSYSDLKMGRMPCCEKVGLKKGPWTPEEDEKLVAYVGTHGHGNWRSVPAKAGLQRCGKSCRLRWINYLRPDIKRGEFSLDEDRTITQLHALLGNKWSIIASHLPKRTDNEIKNYWNTNIKKRLIRMGLDPNTHTPKPNPFEDHGNEQPKDAVNINHMAQWESARLEAEARESMFQFRSIPFHCPRLIISKIPTQPQYQLNPTSTKHNDTRYNMYALMLATDHDLIQSSITSLSFPSRKFTFPTIVRQSLDTKRSLLSKDDGSVIETSNQTHKTMNDYVSNLQDDDIMMAVEAFTTQRCESIQELFNGSTTMEDLINI